MISIKNLYYRYGGGSWLLNDLSLEVKAGEYLSIAGDNGCGKTTFLKLLLGFLQPERGSIKLGTDRIGYVPQGASLRGDKFPLSVGEMLGSYCRLLGLKERDAEISRALEKVRAQGLERRLTGELSGGQLQKVLIARALLGSRELLFLDEPSIGIDNKSQYDIYSVLRNLNRQDGITIVAVEHNLKAALRNSTRIYHLYRGHGHTCSPVRYAAELKKDLEEHLGNL